MKKEINLLINDIEKFNSASQCGFDIIKNVVNLYNKIGFTKYFYKVFFTLLENRDKFVNYNNGYIGFYLEPDGKTNAHGLRNDICYFGNLSVIGNIYDNPELLEE